MEYLKRKEFFAMQRSLRVLRRGRKEVLRHCFQCDKEIININNHIICDVCSELFCSQECADEHFMKGIEK